MEEDIYLNDLYSYTTMDLSDILEGAFENIVYANCTVSVSLTLCIAGDYGS